MRTISYGRAPFPVRADLSEAHSRFWSRLARAGEWWSGAERVEIAGETRRAWSCALCAERRKALSPYAVTPSTGAGDHDRSGDRLPDVAVDVVHRIVTDPSRLTRRWYEKVTRELTPERYVEIVGTVVAMVSIDSFCLALGLDLNPLPEPLPGAPTGYRPASARLEEAWVPVVPDDNSDTPEADLWPARRTGWVIRAMSLVPNEVRTLCDLGAAHYLPNHEVGNPEFARGALTRPQIELVAGRVSALNQCFY